MAVQASTLLTQHGKGSLSVHLIYVLLLQEHFMPVMYTQNKKNPENSGLVSGDKCVHVRCRVGGVAYGRGTGMGMCGSEG